MKKIKGGREKNEGSTKCTKAVGEREEEIHWKVSMSKHSGNLCCMWKTGEERWWTTLDTV